MTTQSSSHLLWGEEVWPWLSLDGSGDAHVFEARDCDIVGRTGITLDYVRRILRNHPLSTTLARERAVVINVEAIQAIITANLQSVSLEHRCLKFLMHLIVFQEFVRSKNQCIHP